jgi:phosphocarrier protein
MVSDRIVIRSRLGLHLRPASLLSQEAIKYSSHISLKSDHTTANAKSVLGVLGACVKSGNEIEIICEGTDENEALHAIIDLLRRINLEEEEQDK